MKIGKTCFVLSLAVFVSLGIYLPTLAFAGGTNVSPQGVEFPDGSRQSTAARRWYKTILVSPKSTTAASGTALRNALDGIDDASQSNPYLIIIEPGVYYLAAYSLQMKSYVDIQGSGENVTIIKGVIPTETLGVVLGKSNAELRFLTVKNEGGFGNATAIYNGGESPSLLHVTIEAFGGTNNRGVYNDYDNGPSNPSMTHVKINAHGGTESYGVHNKNSSPIMTHVTVEASGATTNYAVKNETSGPTMTDVKLEGAGGTSKTGYGIHQTGYSTARINHSVIIADDYTIFCNTNGTVYVSGTQLSGGGDVFDYDGNHVKCAGVFDQGYTFYTSSCP